MKPILKQLLEQLTQGGEDFGNVESGELLPTRQKVALLGGYSNNTGAVNGAPRPAPVEPHRRVAVVAERELGHATLRYALNVCERMKADLDVLTGTAQATLPEQVRLARGQRDIRCEVKPVDGDFLAGVARYAWAAGSLLFVVTAAGDGLAERASDRAQTGGIPGQVPWVVVADDKAAA